MTRTSPATPPACSARRDLAELAHRAGVSARVLTSWAVAWREGGAGGLAVAVGPPAAVDPAAVDEARTVLTGPVTVRGNRITAGRKQLRLGDDGLWYLFTRQFNDWTLAAPPSPDPTKFA